MCPPCFFLNKAKLSEKLLVHQRVSLRLTGVWRRGTWRRRRRRSSASRTCSAPGGSGGRRTTSSTSRASSSEGGDKCVSGSTLVCAPLLGWHAPPRLCKLISAPFCEPQTDTYTPSSVLFILEHLRATTAPGGRLTQLLRAVLGNPFNGRCVPLTGRMRPDAEWKMLGRRKFGTSDCRKCPAGVFS